MFHGRLSRERLRSSRTHHHGAVEDQPHDQLIGQRAGVPRVPSAPHLTPHPAHRTLAPHPETGNRARAAHASLIITNSTADLYLETGPLSEGAGGAGIDAQPLGVRVKPSSSQPVTPPIIILTGSPRRESRTAALFAPLQCGPAQ